MPRELILDHLKQVWLGTEATFLAGPATLPLTTDALDHISIDTNPPKKRVIPNLDQTGNRGARAPIRGAYDPMSLTLLCHLKGSGSATTAPDFGPLLKAAGFTETVGADVTYSRALTPTTSAWVWVAHKDGSEGKMYAGAVVGEVSMPDVGVDAQKIQFQATAAAASTVYATGVGVGGITAIATSLPLDTGHGWVIGGAPAFIEVTEGALVEVMKVTAVSGDTATVVRNVDSGGADAFTAAATIKAYCPARTVSSQTPIGETAGSFTLNFGSGAESRLFYKYGVTIRTGLDLLDKEAFQSVRQGMTPMRYGEDAARITADGTYTTGTEGLTYLHAHHNNATSTALVLTIGSTVGNRCLVTFPTAQVIDISAPDGADGPRKCTAIFGAYSEDGADLTIKFN